MNDIERTLVFVKPDGVRRKLVGEVIGRFEKKGFEIAELKKITITPELADRHYAEHIGKPFYPPLKDFICSGPVVIMVLEGRNAVESVRQMIGCTDSAKAAPGTIRGDLSLLNNQNIVHASDSLESATREISNFFGF